MQIHRCTRAHAEYHQCILANGLGTRLMRDCCFISTEYDKRDFFSLFLSRKLNPNICLLVENGLTMCHHYWPVEGSAQFDDYEVNSSLEKKSAVTHLNFYYKVNLVSEHIWSDDYVVRSFYLKNIQTMETRTVTQFHFLTWDEFSIPPLAKSVLDFRRYIRLKIYEKKKKWNDDR